MCLKMVMRVVHGSRYDRLTKDGNVRDIEREGGRRAEAEWSKSSSHIRKLTHKHILPRLTLPLANVPGIPRSFDLKEVQKINENKSGRREEKEPKKNDRLQQISNGPLKRQGSWALAADKAFQEITIHTLQCH